MALRDSNAAGRKQEGGRASLVIHSLSQLPLLLPTQAKSGDVRQPALCRHLLAVQASIFSRCGTIQFMNRQQSPITPLNSSLPKCCLLVPQKGTHTKKTQTAHGEAGTKVQRTKLPPAGTSSSWALLHLPSSSLLIVWESSEGGTHTGDPEQTPKLWVLRSLGNEQERRTWKVQHGGTAS